MFLVDLPSSVADFETQIAISDFERNIRFGIVAVEIVEIDVFEAGLSDEFEGLLLLLEEGERVDGDLNVVGLATRIKALLGQKCPLVVLEVIENDVLFPLEIAVKRRPAHAGLPLR